MESIDMNEVVNDNLVASKQASKQASCMPMHSISF